MKESDIERIAGIGFDGLVQQIRQIDEHARRDTAGAVNIGLTLRNWSIGFHIDHYELKGADRSHRRVLQPRAIACSSTPWGRNNCVPRLRPDISVKCSVLGPYSMICASLTCSPR